MRDRWGDPRLLSLEPSATQLCQHMRGGSHSRYVSFVCGRNQTLSVAASVICMWTKPNTVSGCVLPESKPVARAARKLRHERCVCGVVQYEAMLSEPWPSNMRDAQLSSVLTNGG